MGEALFLEILSPLPDPGDDISYVSTPSVTIVGRTRVDAAVTVQDTFADVDEEGRFEVTLQLDEEPIVIEVVASVGTGEEELVVLTVAYEPEE